MIGGYKVCIVTPAGRRKYMEKLVYHLEKQASVIDEYKIWQNTFNADDIEYFRRIKDKSKLKITIENRDGRPDIGANYGICHFYNNCTDENTVYIRFDDDIVWMEADFVQKLVEFRIKNPQYFLVFGNIMNNAVCDHIHQRFNALEYGKIVGYHPMDDVGWKDAEFAERKHLNFLSKLRNNQLDLFKFNEWVLWYFDYISINCISWLGKEFKKFNGAVGKDEEKWLSIEKPKELNKPNCIYGQSLCCHYAFWPQRNYLDGTNVLHHYDALTYG